MNIGIVGAGNVAQAIATLATKHDFDVMISSTRSPKEIENTAKEIRCRAGTVHDAIGFSEFVVLAIPFSAYTDLSAHSFDDKLVVDAMNYFPQRDGALAALDGVQGISSELVASQLPMSNVVKAFNAIPMKELERDARPACSPRRRALPIAGYEDAAKDIVIELHDRLGYDALDTGGLADIWRFQPGTPAFCVFFEFEGLEEVILGTRRP